MAGGRSGGIPDRGVAAGRPGRADPGARGPVRRQDRDGCGAGGALLAPLVLDAPDTPHRILGSPVMVTLGRWSYGLFVWHLAALGMVFPIIGEFAFNGHMPVVLVLTLVIGFAIAAVSYALVESPCRMRCGAGSIAAAAPASRRRRWTVRSASGPSQPRDDLVAHRRPPRLARVVAQRRVDEFDHARHLVARDPVGEERKDGGFVERRRRERWRTAPDRGRRRARRPPSTTAPPDGHTAPTRSRPGRRCGRRR